MDEYPFEFYRALHRGNEGDVDFYRRVSAGERAVLELGAGAGRIARAIAADGSRVVGIESSAEAVAAGKAAPHGARMRWVSGSFEDFSLGERFDRVIAPYNAIYCLTTREAQLACFRAVAAHLRPGGYFVFDVWPADRFHAEGGEEAETEPEEVAEITVLGRRYRVLESSRWDREACFLDVRYTHIPVEGGEPVVTRIPQRYLLLPELEALLHEAGLELVVLHGGFDQHVFDDEESERLIVTATLAQG